MIGFDFSGLSIRLTGLPQRQEARFRQLWAPFVAAGAGEPWLDVAVTVADRRTEPRGEDARGMTSSVAGRASRWAMVGGGAHVPPTGAIDFSVEDGEGDATIFRVVNLLHAAVAWRLPAVGGAMLHAAAVVFEGRAFVLPGAEGAGKSTWARAAAAAGATVLSDDIVLVAPEGPGFVALGSPLRAKEFGGGRPGRWPLAAILLPRHGARVAVEPAGTLFVQAALTANLPFVIDDPTRHAEVDDVVARLGAAVPGRTLVFTREDAGLGALAGALR